MLAQFRHQHFLLFLIAHFQKVTAATLLMVSDELAEALMGLDISDARGEREALQAAASCMALRRFPQLHPPLLVPRGRRSRRRCGRHSGCAAEHLETEPLYVEVKERIHDMNGYLDADALRRQANTVVRLTVVTIFGLIGTVTTGFLGMNLLAAADAGWAVKLWYFTIVFVATIALTFYTLVKSTRLSDFLDLVSDERISSWTKVKAFFAVWGR